MKAEGSGFFLNPGLGVEDQNWGLKGLGGVDCRPVVSYQQLWDTGLCTLKLDTGPQWAQG